MENKNNKKIDEFIKNEKQIEGKLKCSKCNGKMVSCAFGTFMCEDCGNTISMDNKEMEKIVKETEIRGYATSIEHIATKAFNCKRYDIGGIIDQDVIQYEPLMVIFSTLTFILANANETIKNKILNFIENNSTLSKLSIKEILNSDNGKEQIEHIINIFSEITEDFKKNI